MSVYVIPTIRISSREVLHQIVDAFDLELNAIYPEEGEAIDHAQLRRGDGWVMLSTPNRELSLETTPGGNSLYWVLERDEDVDAAHERAVAAGMTSHREPEDQDYGGRNCTLRDPDGNFWSFGSYRPEGT